MTEPTPRPSRLLKIVAGFARWSLGLLLAFWLLLALAWGALHGWIVPRIGEFRPQIESRASKALGVAVRIGDITARSEGLIPSIELLEVALLDAEGRAALRLPRVVVSLSPRSLLHWGFEQLYIDSPDLDVRRGADSRLYVAGLPVAQSASGDSSAATDWLFSQGEVVIRGGTLRWNDELRGAPELALSKVDLVLRNGNWRHSLRIDATPPEAWGDRFTLVGMFRAPLLRVRDSNWQHWNGQLYANFSRVDVSRLRHHADVGIDVAHGHGALRAWADVQRGQIVGGTADLALADVQATLGPDLQALELPSVQGRLGGRRLQGGFEFSTQALQFVADDGLHWPGGNLKLQYTEGAGKTPAQGDFRADKLDLAALAQIASRLPLGSTAHEAITQFAPKGMVQEIQASWKGPLEALQQYQVRGRVQGLTLAGATPTESTRTPGLRGADVDFDLTQTGGKASVSMASGALVLPRVFEDPVLPLDEFNASVRWQIEGDRIAVQANDIRFANADAQGHARLSWHTSDPARVPHASRFPGVLDLSGVLTRADGTRVYRYLPLSVPAESRSYVQQSVVAGVASHVDFKVRGDLHDMPFNDPKQGDFRIAAKVKDVTYAYVPPGLLPNEALRWPALTKLNGELIFERSSMQVRGASGTFMGLPQTRLTKVEAQIPNLAHTVVGVHAEARGPLPEMLGLMATSPLARMTGNALAQASGSGNADLQLRLSLPISEIDKSKVQGSVTLSGNDVRITPDTPALSRARGVVQFSETGFALSGVQARALGGDVKLEGGMRSLPAGAPATESAIQVRAQGVATAQGLQQTPSLGFVAQLARSATGSAPYTLALTFRRGVPELQLTTSLQGMALDLPAPLGKSAESAQPLRYEQMVARESLVNGGAGPSALPLRDQITVDVAGVGNAMYLRDISGTQPRVLRGSIAVGLGAGEAAALPAEGVAANLRLGKVDVDAWERLLDTSTRGLAIAGPAAPAASAAPKPVLGPGPASHPAMEYLPSTVALRAAELTAQGRTLRNLVAGGLREGSLWRANLDAAELSGYVEYRPPAASDAGSGRLFARLSRLSMPQSEATQVEALLTEQPGALPAVDVVVDDFELRGRKLGRIEIEAQNRNAEGAQREWRLNKFNITTPEASMTATGNWALLNQSRGGAGMPRAQERRTVLNFKLDIRDSGDLLGRFGMVNVVRRGKGRMEGQVGWIGAPFSPDYRSMAGQVNVNIEAGQFLKADPGLAKLLSVLSLQSLPRRLTLDFRDVFSEGFAFDFIRGDMHIEQGVASTNNLQMKGVNAAVLMEGSADIDKETQNLRVVVVPEINAMTASLVATAINPVVGLGSFLAQVFLRGPLIEAATQEFHIDGGWADPRVVRVPRRGRDAPPAGQSPGGPGAAVPEPQNTRSEPTRSGDPS
ncbi:TIGR02099 family protein [Acidovorax sp. DW039]|uniref:YhdP family protein n=1 Tax=Acidovorax sp. DW039 TaxID=3095606 RepID=UPI00308F0C86|nr:TIGR02099 family protein [Acidovorax sp. DW039]